MPRKPFKRESRIKAEEERLTTICEDMEEDVKTVVEGLIKRIAFLRINLEDMEKDILDNGITEDFQQSEKVEPYQRVRPIVIQFNSFLTNYKGAIKQLSAFLPKNSKINEDDGFKNF